MLSSESGLFRCTRFSPRTGLLLWFCQLSGLEYVYGAKGNGPWNRVYATVLAKIGEWLALIVDRSRPQVPVGDSLD